MCAVTRDRRRWLGPLGVRLALAFVIVALAAVAVLAGLTALGARRQVDDLARRQHADQARVVAAAAGQAYDAGGDWSGADLLSAVALAAGAGADVEVRDTAGQLVPLPAGHEEMMGDLMGRMGAGSMGSMTTTTAVSVPLGGPVVEAPVTSGGRRVGTVRLRFPPGLSDAQRHVADALVQVVGAAAGLAALVALGVALFVSRRVSRPVAALTEAAGALESGDRSARVAMSDAPGELGELAGAFDRMADTLDRQEALRRALVADVAHELRTPVTILQASCEALVDGIRDPTINELSSLHDETLRLGRLVADLETLSAAEAAGLHLDTGPLDLAEVAADAARSVGARAEQAGLVVDVKLEPVVVNGDAGRVHQVVVNLLSNAVKYTPPGGRITLTTARDGHLARMEVSDTGPGIPEEELPHVFDRFWRGVAGATSSGSGIGLAVVAELVRAHHGQVHVSSEVGRGSRFTVLLPTA